MTFDEIEKSIEDQRKKETMSQAMQNRILLKLYEDVKKLQADNEYIRRQLLALAKKVDQIPPAETPHWSEMSTRRGSGGGWTEL